MGAHLTGTPDPATDKPPRRRWIPVSLRMFMAILVVSGIMSTSWIVSVWWAYDREQQVVDKIKGSGQDVATDTVGPVWLLHLVGKKRLKELRVFERVKYVWLWKAEVIDSEIANLSSLKSIERLRLDGTNVTDAGLTHLTGLKNLKSLQISRTWVTEKGIKELSSVLPDCHIQGYSYSHFPARNRSM